MDPKITIMIPARMESTRFPGKPLAPISGIPMVVYCAKNAIATGLDVFVCTDSKEIKSVCELYDVKAILTNECATGTDRIAKALKDIETDYIINLQGDEPLINVESINMIINMIPKLEKNDNKIITGLTSVLSDEAFDPNNVKCAFIEKLHRVQYLSRKPLLNNQMDNGNPVYFKQIGLYAMSTINLKRFSSLKEGILEKSEKVELLRWIENGFELLGCKLNCNSISVDTPIDLVNVIAKLKDN